MSTVGARAEREEAAVKIAAWVAVGVVVGWLAISFISGASYRWQCESGGGRYGVTPAGEGFCVRGF